MQFSCVHMMITDRNILLQKESPEQFNI